MRRKFGTANAVMQKYLSIIDKNTPVWHKITPPMVNSTLDFYEGRKKDEEALNYSLSVLWDMLGRKGKKIRPVLMLMLADILKVPQEQALPLSYLVETVHNSTLIIDDIQDNSVSRRGEPCCHLKFGIDNSLNAGILGFFLPVHNMFQLEPFQKLESSLKLELLNLYIQEMKNIHLGLAWDIHWHGKKYSVDTLPTEENYYMMVESKTSVLIRIGFRMIAAMKNCSDEERSKLVRISNLVGTSFQIQDDLINLVSESYSAGRGVGMGEDITEGKITLMVLEHVKRTKDQWLLDLLHQKTTDQKLIDEAIERMKLSGALNYADSVQRTVMQEAVELVRSLDGEHTHKEDFVTVLDGLLGRSK